MKDNNMPTGYTADLEGVSFPEFALRCARAFGALIDLRDEPLDAPLPDRIMASTHSQKQLTTLFNTLREVESWDAPCASGEARVAHKKALQRREGDLKESNATRKCYEGMIQRVKDWAPPTAEHTGLKDFMLKQLTESIKFDCWGEKNFPMPQAQSGLEYQHRRLCGVLQDIEYYAKSYQEELERLRERTKWLRELRLSLEI